MATFDFEIRCYIPEISYTTDAIIEKLYKVGCDDALIGIGQPQQLCFMFSRDANSRKEAIASAKEAIMNVLPEAVFV